MCDIDEEKNDQIEDDYDESDEVKADMPTDEMVKYLVDRIFSKVLYIWIVYSQL